MYRPKYTSGFFYSVRIETTHKPSKEAAAKNFFPIVYVLDATCFDEYILSYVTDGRRYFFLKPCRYLEIFSTAILLFSLKQVFCYLLNNNTVQTVLLPKFENIAIV